MFVDFTLYKKVKIHKKSLTIATAFVLLTVICILFIGLMNSTYRNEINKLKTPVMNRTLVIEKYLNHLTINAINASEELAKTLDLYQKENVLRQQEECMPFLMDILEHSNTTGTFIVFGELIDFTNRRESLYIRDTKPQLVQFDYSDILFLRGPDQIAKKYNIPIDSEWRYCMPFDKNDCDYYSKPLEAKQALNTNVISICGFWSNEFRLTDTDKRIITYTVPLIGNNGNCYGIFGIEVTIDMLISNLPVVEIPFSNSFYYMNKSFDKSHWEVNGGVMSGAYGDIALKDSESMLLRKLKNWNHMYSIHIDNNKSMLGMVKELKLYNPGDYYEQENWALAGIVDEKSLFYERDKIVTSYVLILLLITVLLSIGVILIKYKSSKELTKVKESIESKEAFIEREATRNLFNEFIERTKTLTQTESMIFKFYVEGKTAQDVVELMSISTNTLKVHNNHIYSKLNISSRDELNLYISLIKKSGQLSDLI